MQSFWAARLCSGLMRENLLSVRTISWRFALIFFLWTCIKLSPLDCLWIMQNSRWATVSAKGAPANGSSVSPLLCFIFQKRYRVVSKQRRFSQERFRLFQSWVSYQVVLCSCGTCIFQQSYQNIFCSQFPQLKSRWLQNLYHRLESKVCFLDPLYHTQPSSVTSSLEKTLLHQIFCKRCFWFVFIFFWESGLKSWLKKAGFTLQKIKSIKRGIQDSFHLRLRSQECLANTQQPCILQPERKMDVSVLTITWPFCTNANSTASQDHFEEPLKRITFLERTGLRCFNCKILFTHPISVRLARSTYAKGCKLPGENEGVATVMKHKLCRIDTVHTVVWYC